MVDLAAVGLPQAEEAEEGLVRRLLALDHGPGQFRRQIETPQHLRQFPGIEGFHQPQKIDQPALVVIFEEQQVVPGEHRLDPFQHGAGGLVIGQPGMDRLQEVVIPPAAPPRGWGSPPAGSI